MSFILEGSLRRASMQLLFPLSPRKLASWMLRTYVLLVQWMVFIKSSLRFFGNRLKIVLEKIIYSSQNAFIRGRRQILDSVLVAN
jgi:hypothetical protein